MLRQELARPSYTPGLLALGSATDCYQPIERELRLTRAVLEVLSEASVWVAVDTSVWAASH